MLWMQQIGNYWEIHTWMGFGVETGYWVGKRRNVLPDPLSAANPIPTWLSPAAGDDPTGGRSVGTADTCVRSYTEVRKNTFRGCIVCTLLWRRVRLGGLTALHAAWCPLVSPPSSSAALCTGAVSPIPIGTSVAASVLLDIRQNRSPGVSRCQFTGLRRVGHVVFGVTVVQVVTVVEGCRDAGIGSDPHRRGHGLQLQLSPASQCQCRSRSQWNFLFAGAAQSARFSPCLSRPLPVFSASSPKQPAPYWPSHPLLATTPLPPLPPSRFLSCGHLGTSALSCPLPRLPPCPLAVVTWWSLGV